MYTFKVLLRNFADEASLSLYRDTRHISSFSDCLVSAVLQTLKIEKEETVVRYICYRRRQVTKGIKAESTLSLTRLKSYNNAFSVTT